MDIAEDIAAEDTDINRGSAVLNVTTENCAQFTLEGDYGDFRFFFENIGYGTHITTERIADRLLKEGPGGSDVIFCW